MRKDKLKETASRLALYLIIATGLTFLLIVSKEQKFDAIFWLYIGIMGISAIIARFFNHSVKKSKIIRVSEHIAYICFITLMLLWFTVTYVVP